MCMQATAASCEMLRAPSTTAIFNRNRDLQRQPRPNFPVYGLRQPQPPPWLADRCCGCCWSEFSDIWWAELKVAVEVAVVYGQKRPDLVSFASKNNAIFARSSESRSDIVENCDSTEKDWTDRSLRVWADHQQQSQPRSGCTSRLRLKSLSWMGPFTLEISVIS